MTDTLDLDALDSDGATLDLGDGTYSLRLRIEPDLDSGINDYECYGKISTGYRYGDRDRNGNYIGRPDGFDGNAEKLGLQGAWCWWQPPSDVKRGTPEFNELRSLVHSLAEYGFYVELLHGVDAYKRPIVIDMDVVGGVDSVSYSNIRDLVGELVGEVTARHPEATNPAGGTA